MVTVLALSFSFVLGVAVGAYSHKWLARKKDEVTISVNKAVDTVQEKVK